MAILARQQYPVSASFGTHTATFAGTLACAIQSHRRALHRIDPRHIDESHDPGLNAQFSTRNSIETVLQFRESHQHRTVRQYALGYLAEYIRGFGGHSIETGRIVQPTNCHQRVAAEKFAFVESGG